MYHHPPSTPHLFSPILTAPTYSKGFGSVMLSVTQLESPSQGAVSRSNVYVPMSTSNVYRVQCCQIEGVRAVVVVR